MKLTLEVTQNELRVLRLLASIDLDALGMERSDQTVMRTLAKKLRALSEGEK